MKYSILPLLLAVGLLAACSKDDSSNSQSGGSSWGSRGGSFGARATSVETYTTQRDQIALEVRAFGTVQAQDIVSIIPQVSNRIIKMYVDLGDTVTKGQVLAKIYDAPFRGQVEGAKAQIKQAQVALSRDSAQYERQRQLFESNLTSEFDFQNAEATYLNSLNQLSAARGNFAQSQDNLANTEVRSPVNGVVTARFAEEGNIASAGQALFELANLVGYESRIFVPVQDWSQIKIGQEVRLKASNQNENFAKGVVSRKSPQLDATTGLGEIVVSLVETGATIYPGILTENIITIESKPSVVVVPRSALVEKVETVLNPESNSIELERSYAVFVAKGDTVAERRILELGIEQGDKIEVLSGLAAGESIILTGQSGLSDGARIQVTKGTSFSAPERKTLADGEVAADSTATRPQPTVDRAAMRQIMQNMSDEDRAKMRNMSQEERRAYFRKLAAERDSSMTN